jgi:hypothetical protein
MFVFPDYLLISASNSFMFVFHCRFPSKNYLNLDKNIPIHFYPTIADLHWKTISQDILLAFWISPCKISSLVAAFPQEFCQLVKKYQFIPIQSMVAASVLTLLSFN